MKNIVFLQHTFCLPLIISIGFIFTLNQVIKFFNYNITIPIHMLIHFYTIIALFYVFLYQHNFF